MPMRRGVGCIEVFVAVGLMSLLGCEPEVPPASGEPLDHPCSAAWGFDEIPSGALFVDPAADEDAGDGSLDAPFATLGAALTATRDAGSGTRLLLLADGEYRATPADRRFALSDTWGDDDLVLQGCGIDQTVFVAIEAPPPGEEADDELWPGLEIYGQVQGVAVRDLTIRGGRRSVIVRDGAGDERPVVLERVRVEDSVRIGILALGLNTKLTLIDTVVDGVEADGTTGGALGYGIASQAGGAPWDDVQARLVMDGGAVTGATRVGILLDHCDAELTMVSVMETQPGPSDARDGIPQLGRGVQIQQVATAVLDGVVATGNTDAAVFLQLPLDVTVQNSTMSDTQRAVIPGAEEAPPAGDGLVATQPGIEAVDTWQVTLSGNTFANNGRAGALVETVAVTADAANVFTGNQLTTDGETYPVAPTVDGLYSQADAEVTGDSVEVGEGTAYDALEIFRDALELDNLAE